MALFSRKAPRAAVPSPGAGAARPAAPAGSSAATQGSTAPGAWREDRVLALGSDMLNRARGHKAGLLSKQFWSDKLMDWSMKDQGFKVQMFRFVDCFPTLKTPEAIHEHLVDYLTQPGVTAPPGMSAGLAVGGIAKGLMAGTIASQIKGMAGKFIAGVDAADALPGLKQIWNDGIAFSVDLLGEACVSDEEATAYQRKYLDLVGNLPSEVAGWKANERLERDHLGAIPRVNVSIKISSLSARCSPMDPEGSIADLMRGLEPIIAEASRRGVFVNFDMEQFALKDLTLDLFMRCCEKWDFHAGLAMQAYLKSGDDDARRIADWARRSGRIVTVRLVKGAYWDYETINAEQMGWPCPVWNTKRETDASFERMTEILLDACPRAEGAAGGSLTRRTPGAGGVKLALGSHNVRSIAAALDGLERRGLPMNALELQMLHGMADQLKHAAAEMGLRVREYVPVGEMIPGMAYLVRRLLENTSNESWLRAGFLDNADTGALLRSPHVPPPGFTPRRDLWESAAERHALSPAVEGVGDGRAFVNEPMRDFSRAAVREAFSRAVQSARVPSVANDGTAEHASQAVGRAQAFFPTWRDTEVEARAAVLTRAAALMRARRDELSAVMIREAGKTWREADADTCEAIDFCEYYARLAVPMFRRTRLGRFIGELDETWHQPRGVAVVISPWNFPLAICCGMTVAALVTGNTVVLKPAEQTPGIARLLADILFEAGLPRDALQFVPGPGETVGAALVRDPRIALIAFTGSKAVGLDILNAAAPPSPFGPQSRDASALWHVKKVVCEMGGKNAVIVDTSADVDEAVLGVRHSAFGFQGQKCSACSRVIVVDPEGERGPHITNFIHRITESTRALAVNDPALPGTDVGPVIDAEAKQKIGSYIDAGIARRLQHLALPVPDGLEQRTGRHFVAPHIFWVVKADDPLATDEIFGPVLAVMHASSYEQALAIANGLPYKLTGGVFTRKPAHIEMARRDFRVGNLYINRGITGALVARQPFGGFGMSGVGSKAGGADYLLQFTEPRAVCENTLRRGFAPEL